MKLNILLAIAFCLLSMAIPLEAQSGSVIEATIFHFLEAHWQANGDYIAFEGEDRIWIMDSSLAEIVTLIPEPFPEDLTHANILDVAWSPDGSKLAATVFSSASELQSTRLVIWDTSTWQITNELFNAVSEINFSPDSRYIATQAGYSVAIYDLDTQTEVNRLQLYRAASIVWNPIDINEIAIGHGFLNVILLVNPFNGETLQELPYSYGFFPSYSPNGHFLALGRFDENGVRIVDVLDTTNYSVIASFPHENGLYEETESIYWLGNEEIGTSSFLGEALRWNVLTGEKTILPVLSQRSQAYWKSDGSVFIAKGFDEMNNEGIFVYDGLTGEIVSQLVNTESPTATPSP